MSTVSGAVEAATDCALLDLRLAYEESCRAVTRWQRATPPMTEDETFALTLHLEHVKRELTNLSGKLASFGGGHDDACSCLYCERYPVTRRRA